jgi:hypothetical protein
VSSDGCQILHSTSKYSNPDRHILFSLAASDQSIYMVQQDAWCFAFQALIRQYGIQEVGDF